MKIKRLLIVGVLALGGCVSTTPGKAWTYVAVDDMVIRVYPHPKHIDAFFVSGEGYGYFQPPPRPVFKETAIKAVEIHTGCKVSTAELISMGGGISISAMLQATVKCPPVTK